MSSEQIKGLQGEVTALIGDLQLLNQRYANSDPERVAANNNAIAMLKGFQAIFSEHNENDISASDFAWIGYFSYKVLASVERQKARRSLRQQHLTLW